MSQTVTIRNLGLSFVPASNVTASIWYRLPDQFIAFILVTSTAVVLPNGDLQTPVSIGSLPDQGTLDLKAKINCSDEVIIKTIKLGASKSCRFYKITNLTVDEIKGGYQDCITGLITEVTIPAGIGQIVYVCARKNSVAFVFAPEGSYTIVDQGSCAGGTTTTTTTNEMFTTTTSTTTAAPATTTTTTMEAPVGIFRLINTAHDTPTDPHTWSSWLVKINGDVVAYGGEILNGGFVEFNVNGYAGATVEVIVGYSLLTEADGVFSSGAMAGAIAVNKATFTPVDISGNVTVNLF